MSPLERPVPPAGEEIHISEGSIQPLLLAAFLTVALVGVTFAWPLSLAGGIGAVWVIVRWVKDARQELEELPAHHER